MIPETQPSERKQRVSLAARLAEDRAETARDKQELQVRVANGMCMYPWVYGELGVSRARRVAGRHILRCPVDGVCEDCDEIEWMWEVEGVYDNDVVRWRPSLVDASVVGGWVAKYGALSMKWTRVENEILAVVNWGSGPVS